MIKRQLFKATDLVKLDCPSIDNTMTHFICHVVRAGGDKAKLDLLREALEEIDNFIIEILAEQDPEVN